MTSNSSFSLPVVTSSSHGRTAAALIGGYAVPQFGVSDFIRGRNAVSGRFRIVSSYNP